jgi:hypothetical protein
LSDWTHAICEVCWAERYGDQIASRVTPPEIEHCCYCGRHTTSGRYVRDDPNAIDGHEDHKRGAVTR